MILKFRWNYKHSKIPEKNIVKNSEGRLVLFVIKIFSEAVIICLCKVG